MWSGLLDPCPGSLGLLDARPECGAAGPAYGHSHRVVDVHKLEEGELREGSVCGVQRRADEGRGGRGERDRAETRR